MVYYGTQPQCSSPGCGSPNSSCRHSYNSSKVISPPPPFSPAHVYPGSPPATTPTLWTGSTVSSSNPYGTIPLPPHRTSTPSSSLSGRSGFGGLALHPVLHCGGNRFAFDVMYATTTIQFYSPVNINDPATTPPKARIGLNFITHPHWAFTVTAANPSIGVTLNDVFTAVSNAANISATDQDWHVPGGSRYAGRGTQAKQHLPRRYECLSSRYFIGLTLSHRPALVPGVEVWDVHFAPANRA